MFSITIKACEKDFDDIVILRNCKSTGLLLPHDSIEESLPPLKKTKLPPDVILIITSFLNYSDQLKLSHVNTEFRANLNEGFWKKQIIKEGYLLWDSSMSNAKTFFANYSYQKGFGRHPKLREKIVTKMKDITSLPNQLLAEKALNLGFPKGKENYRQVEHKKGMLKIALNNKEKYRFEEPTSLQFQSNFLWFFNVEWRRWRL